MPFFPPQLIPNNRAYISDDKQAMALLPRRFGNHNLPCVIYWPWLSWDGIDVSVTAQQTGLARATLIGESGFDLPCSTLDTHGAVMSFGMYKGFQTWELIHRFTWQDEGVALKKFDLCWLRLWKHGSYQTPDNALPVVGGGTSSSATILVTDQLYETVLPPHGSDFMYFAYPGYAGNYKFTQTVQSGLHVNTHFDSNWPSNPTYYTTVSDTGSWLGANPTAGLQLRVDNQENVNQTIQFKLASA